MYKALGKRLIDILIGIMALPFVLIFLCIFGPLIFISDKGPIFYKAKRIGRGGSFFRMYKFRSMKVHIKSV